VGSSGGRAFIVDDSTESSKAIFVKEALLWSVRWKSRGEKGRGVLLVAWESQLQKGEQLTMVFPQEGRTGERGTTTGKNNRTWGKGGGVDLPVGPGGLRGPGRVIMVLCPRRGPTFPTTCMSVQWKFLSFDPWVTVLVARKPPMMS